MVNENASIELPCPVVVAFPPPTRTWRYERRELFSQSNQHQKQEHEEYKLAENGSLLLVHAKTQHAGIYECHVSNIAGDARIQFVIFVARFMLKIIPFDTVLTHLTFIGENKNKSVHALAFSC